MKKTSYILIALSIIILSGCSTSPLEKYPNFINQKDYIRDFVVASDYTLYSVDLYGCQVMDTNKVKSIAPVLDYSILKNLKLKGYVPSKVFDPSYLPSKNEKLQIDTAQKSNRSSRRIAKRAKPLELSFNQSDSQIEKYLIDTLFKEILSKKISNVDSLNSVSNPKLDVAALFWIRGICLTPMFQTVTDINSGTSPVLSGIAIPYHNSFIEIYFLIVNKKNNSIIWKDKIIENLSAEETAKVSKAIGKMFIEFPQILSK